MVPCGPLWFILVRCGPLRYKLFKKNSKLNLFNYIKLIIDILYTADAAAELLEPTAPAFLGRRGI